MAGNEQARRPTDCRRGILLRLLGSCVLLFCGFNAGAQNAAPELEFQVKSVFLFHFTQFAEWPAQKFPTADAPFIIGVLGPDPFGDYLDDTVRGESVNGHPIEVQRYADVASLQQPHILYVHPSMLPQLGQENAQAQANHMLTVSDAENFAARGGMIRLHTVAGKIRFRINIEAAQAAGLTLSSKLLRRAVIVKSEK